MAGPRFSILPIEVLKDRRLSARDLRVLFALYAFSNREGCCWPSRGLLSVLTGLPAQRISTVTTRLESLGWLNKEGNGGRSRACRYRLKVPDTVTETVTVTDSVTVTKPVTKTVTDSVTKTVAELVTGIEQTMNRPENEPLSVAEATGDYEAEPGHSRAKSQADLFERFWTAYPKKRNKGDALKAWRALKPDAQLADAIVQAIERAKESVQWRKEAGQFIPYPATWLRARGWEDEDHVDVVPLPAERQGEGKRISSSVNALKTLFGENEDGKEIVPAGNGVPRCGLRR